MVNVSEFQGQFNPFYYYYNPESASKALSRQLEMKHMAKEKPLLPPPVLPQLTGLYHCLPHVIATLPVLKIILAVLER